MVKKFNIYLFALLSMFCFSFAACDDDDNDVAKAVLTSATNLSFDAQGAEGKIITVYSDATWTCEHPDWISVTPETGSGTTEVRITVNDNLRDGLPDNPRKADLVFKGVTKASEARVIVRQGGDLFRDVLPITIAQMEENEEESVAIINDLTVAIPLEGAFIATDGKDNVYVQSDDAVSKGQSLNVYGVKGFDANNMSVVVADHMNAGSKTATLPAPVDITENLDSFTCKTRIYVSLTGKIDGSSIVTDSATFKGNVIAAAPDVNIPQLNGHAVTVKAFYAGTASPVVNLIVESVEDHGLVETIYYQEDFEWLDPWSVAGNAGSTVENDNPDATSPQIVTPKVGGVSALAALEAKGYQFHRVTTKTAGECIYLNKNYLKFGKTSYQAGISLPSIEGIPDGEKLELSFDWCPMRQGSGKIDPVNLLVIVKNGADEVQFEVPTHNWENKHKLEWIHATVDLSSVSVDEQTVITIRQTEWPASTANRWFLDNIKIIKK